MPNRHTKHENTKPETTRPETTRPTSTDSELETENQKTSTEDTSPFPDPPKGFKPGPFSHHRLDAFYVAKEALGSGEKIAQALPRGYAKLADQLRRALLASYLGVAEAACRRGADRRNRFVCSQGEASEAAAALEAIVVLGLAPAVQVSPVLFLLARLCAMLARLSQRAR